MHSLYYTIYAAPDVHRTRFLPRNGLIFSPPKEVKKRFIIVIFNKITKFVIFFTKNSIDKRNAKAYYVLKPKTQMQ